MSDRGRGRELTRVLPFHRALGTRSTAVSVRVVILARVGVVRTLGPSLKSRRWSVRVLVRPSRCASGSVRPRSTPGCARQQRPPDLETLPTRDAGRLAGPADHPAKTHRYGRDQRIPPPRRIVAAQTPRDSIFERHTLATIVTLAALREAWVGGIVATSGLPVIVALFVTGRYGPAPAPIPEVAQHQPAQLPQQEVPGAPPSHVAIE